MAKWVSSKEKVPSKSGLYLTLVSMHTGHYFQYELNEFDVIEQRWLFLEPRESVRFWQSLPKLPKLPGSNSPKQI